MKFALAFACGSSRWDLRIDKTSSRPGRTPANVISSGELTASSPIDFQLWEMRFFNLKKVPPRSNRRDARSRRRRNTSQTALTARKLATAWEYLGLYGENGRERTRERIGERESERERGKGKDRRRGKIYFRIMSCPRYPCRGHSRGRRVIVHTSSSAGDSQ